MQHSRRKIYRSNSQQRYKDVNDNLCDIKLGVPYKIVSCYISRATRNSYAHHLLGENLGASLYTSRSIRPVETPPLHIL